MARSFVHLHTHTEFSMLDGAARVKDVVAKAVGDGMPAVGITDHGNMYGILDFYKACKDEGITPVLGTELYMAGESRFERPVRRGRVDDTGGEGERGEKLYYHLTALAETTQGYRNLIKLSSDAYLEGYYMKPRVDWELLDRHREGLIVTTGCLGGVVLQALLRDDFDGAVQRAARLQDIFGRDSMFVELQDHGLPEQHRTNPPLLELARKIKAPLLATNDSHYTHRSDALAHDALLCVQTGSLRDDPNRFKFHGDEHFLKTAAEMRSLFSDLPEACDNTLWIAERADVEIEFGRPQLPQFDLPPGFTTQGEYLRHLTLEGARDRYGDPLPAEVVERLDYELGVIDGMGFSAYFLVVWDLIHHAKSNGIRVGPGRGSAAGCCVAYCLRIVDLDPIRYDLLFERFLNPGRKQMPDIDMDFDSRYRGEMIRYATEKYGWDHVAQIITFSTIKARAAVRDAARVLGYPYGLGDRIAKAMPPLVMGRDTPLWACFEQHPKYEDGYKVAQELRDMYATDPDVQKVVDVAKGLEGLRRQDGIHAAAVVITNEPLTEYLPIQRKPGPGEKPEEAPIVTQYEMHGVEELGLLKMDFLGLRNLDVIEVALDVIEQVRGTRPDIDDIPLDDDPTLAMLRRGESIGVFQLEGGPMRALMKSLAPTTFEDVAALVALYRPGPMAANMHNDYADRKNGRKPIEYLHPDMAQALESTYGLCLTGDTLVFDARTGARLRLDEVDPGSGIHVQGVDEHFRQQTARATNWVCNGEREVVRLKLRNGMELTGTPDHRVLTERGWKQIGELAGDDYVAVPRHLVAGGPDGALDPDRLRVLAYLLADGALSILSVVSFVNKDETVLGAFADSVHRAFPGVHISSSTGVRDVKRLTVGNGKGHGGGASPLLRWLRSVGLKSPAGQGHGGPTSAEKCVPDVVFRQPAESIARFLAALWDCDGHVGRRMAHYKTVSHRLALDVQLLLLRLGIASAISETRYRRPKDGCVVTAFQVSLCDGHRFNEFIAPHIVAPSKRHSRLEAVSKGPSLDRAAVVDAVRASGVSLRRLARTEGITRSGLDRGAPRRNPRVHARTVVPVLEALGLNGELDRCSVQWVGVRSVTPAGRERVYDITVDEIHNFVANGIVAHNCVYQEEMMRLAQIFAGYTLEESDNLRKAAGKKIREVMRKEREKFVAGCERQGYGRDVGTKLFDMIEPFADYAFNKSHSYGYGFVAYQTAYLKAHYPAEYLAALLTSVKDDKDKTAPYLAECRALGIQVRVPDINTSASDFTARVAGYCDDDLPAACPGVIPFGLSAVRNVGEGIVAQLIDERDRNGPFTDFYDFCQRVDPMVLNKRAIESLIKAGGFDSLGMPRKGLLLVYEQIIDRTLARRRERDAGVMSLFDAFGSDDESPASFDDARIPVPDVEFDKHQKLAFEKEMLGLYVSDHPLMGYEAALRRVAECSVSELLESRDGETKTVGGVVTALVRKYTRKGDLMATFVLEDLETSIPAWVFPRTMQDFGSLLTDDAVVVVKGRLDNRDDEVKLVVMEVRRPELVAGATPLEVLLPLSALTDRTVTRLKEILLDHPGASPVFLRMGSKTLALADQFRVDTGNGLCAELRMLLGADCIGSA